jgi:hypothetical protein
MELAIDKIATKSGIFDKVLANKADTALWGPKKRTVLLGVVM